MAEYEIEKAMFNAITVEGSARDIGKEFGTWLRGAHPEFARRYSEGGFDPASKGFSGMAELRRLCEFACPGINEEVDGFAEALGAGSDDIGFWAWSSLGGNCSHAAIAPRASATGGTTVLRSYEWRPDEDDLSLWITRKKGTFAHIGCSCALFGRMEGLNEKGFSVTMSGGMAAGLPNEWRYKKGLSFWVVIRGLMENCADVREGVAFLRDRIPTGNHILILADKSGRAVLAEMGGGELALREMGDDAFLAATNHFTLPKLSPRNKLDFILALSRPRLDYICRNLEEGSPRIGEERLKALLAGEAPNGCFGPWYSQGFGTLWASIFDLGAVKAQYCFGAPGFGAWREFGFDDPVGFKRLEAVFAKK